MPRNSHIELLECLVSHRICPTILVHAEGSTTAVAAETITTSLVDGRMVHSFGDAAEIVEDDIEMTLLDDKAGTITVQLAGGRLVRFDPVPKGTILVL